MDLYNINFSDIKFKKRIGKCGFGIVHLIEYKGYDLVAKTTISYGEDEKIQFTREIEILSRLRSTYIINYYGIC